ncbi:glycosyltransferase family 4 protein [Mycobacterium sp.]|uniref:glycosyltransferase family 4 protein n=1 Tax=Mycobacterium sp. TaxID=1785 RepID=UPI003F9E7579
MRSASLDTESLLGSELSHSGPETLPGPAVTARKTRVILLLHELSRTGAPRVALDALDAMRDEVEVRTIALLDGPLAEDCRAIGPLFIIPEWPPGRIWQRAYGRFEKGRWFCGLRRWAPDLIYINSVAALPITQWVPLPDVPTILHVHELHTELMQVMKRCPDAMVSRPTRYLAASEAVLRALVCECGINEDRIAVVHSFVPERRLDGVCSNQVRRPNDGTLVVGGAGLPGWRKGTTLWLQMAAEVRRLVGPSARFVWVGVPEWPDMDGARFRREAHLMGLDDMVEFIPSTPKALEYFAGFDIFAMTSWEDPCPLVVLENMGLAKPVVCFAGGGGAPEVVGDTGVVVPEFDPLAMARAIAHLAADPPELARLGTLARQRVLANFTDRVQVPKIRREMRLLVDR